MSITAKYRQYMAIGQAHHHLGDCKMTKIVVVLTEGYADWGKCPHGSDAQHLLWRRGADGEPGRRAGHLCGRLSCHAGSGAGRCRGKRHRCADRQWRHGMGATKAYPVWSRCSETCINAASPVAAICGAVRALAEAGLLDDVPHTGNNREELAGVSAYRRRRPFRCTGRRLWQVAGIHHRSRNGAGQLHAGGLESARVRRA